jgi:hypothetical protein
VVGISGVKAVRRPITVLLLAGLIFVLPAAAQASYKVLKRLPNGVERIKYRIGPLDVTPGQNRIRSRVVSGPQRPEVDGWIVRMKPDLVWSGGSREGHPPSTEKVMFHHGVFANLSRTNPTTGGPELFMGSGEEKTIVSFPRPFAYRYKASDLWALNEMIHNLTSQQMTLDISYTVDFIPDGSPAAEGLRPVRAVWMDVENGRGYPVFDIYKGSGGKDGKFTYPRDDPDAYPAGVHKNRWTVDRDGVLVATAGHLHTGGLYTDLSLTRPGAKYAGQKCNSKRRASARRACWEKAPRVKGNTVHLFRSHAKYYEPAGPVSWDVSMKGTRLDWLVQAHKGDTLETQATYETKLGSWYESMGIMVVYMADGTDGRDPYKTKVDYPGQVTHGHLPENSVHGGRATDLPDPRKLPSGASTGDPFLISGFSYGAGDFRIPGAGGRPPVVKKGHSLTFELAAPDAGREEWHSLTSCAAPCNRSTGIAYPIPNGKFRFDSGQLGDVIPAVGRRTWSTPKDLPVGTYPYFCRIHPLMRGAFRVVK